MQTVMDPQAEASVCEARGMLCYYLGDYPQAESWFQRCLKLVEHWRTGKPWSERAPLSGGACTRLGDWHLALRTRSPG